MLTATVPAQKSKRARKRRNPSAAPRAVASTRREERAARAAEADQLSRRADRQLGREGERPSGPFGGFPASEIAILAGIVAAVIGFVGRSTAPLATGLIVCGLGVCEITAREHFSGYRSHAALLAALPSVALEAGVVLAFGSKQRPLLGLIVVPVFAVLFWALRRRFQVARQARVARAARGRA